jgi:hypothetical protein
MSLAVRGALGASGYSYLGTANRAGVMTTAGAPDDFGSAGTEKVYGRPETAPEAGLAVSVSLEAVVSWATITLASVVLYINGTLAGQGTDIKALVTAAGQTPYFDLTEISSGSLEFSSSDSLIFGWGATDTAIDMLKHDQDETGVPVNYTSDAWQSSILAPASPSFTESSSLGLRAVLKYKRQ